MIYDFRWHLKDGVVTDKSDKNFHSKASVWAYKRDVESGRLVPCGSHPEHKTRYGEEKYLQAAIYRYAMSGRGRPTVKAELASGLTRQMSNNSSFGHERIGDMQYHHFTIEVPKDTAELEIVLDGEMYDMNLYAKLGDFAFRDENEVYSAENGSGADEVLKIENPEAGKWYIGVKCNTAVESTNESTHYRYTGKFEVLNGLAYSITANVHRLETGDLNSDNQVNWSDLKIMSDNWMNDNIHTRRLGELIGWWDFAEGAGDVAADISGNGCDANLYGDASWQGEAVALDGNGDYLQTAESLERLQLTDAYTIAVRLNAAAVQTDGAGIVTKCTSGPGIAVNYWSLIFGYYDMAGKLVMFNGMESWDTGIELTEISGDWHDVAVVFGGGHISSYLDGEQVKYEAFSALPASGTGVLRIGSDRQMFRYYAGGIDDMMIFDYELSPAEVMDLSDVSSGQQLGQPRGKWTFNSGDALDSSGNDFHGTLMDNASVVDNEARGKVLSLQGRAFVELPVEAFADVNEQVTITMWEKGNVPQPTNGIIFAGSNSHGRVFMAQVPSGDGKISFDAGNAVNYVYDNISKAIEGDEFCGDWNHWAFSKDAGSGSMSIYLNGELWHSGTEKTLLMSGVSSFLIGHPMAGYNGLMDDFCVYDYCMSLGEVQSYYNAGLAEKDVCPKAPAGDVNGDCRVDYLDSVKLAENWLN